MTSLSKDLTFAELSGKIVCFDLDHTLCIPGAGPDTQSKYAEAEPMVENIQKLVSFKERGARIVIFTARRMLTHNGDVEKVKADVGLVTENWLSEHGVPYDELIFGKPYYDYFIDDKALNVEEL